MLHFANCNPLEEQLETTVYLFQINLPEGLKAELSLSLLLEACPNGLRVWARDAKPVTGWSHSGWEGLGQAGQQGSWTQSGHSARDSVSKYNTAKEICIRLKRSIIEASAIWEKSILFLICRKLGVENGLKVVKLEYFESYHTWCMSWTLRFYIYNYLVESNRHGSIPGTLPTSLNSLPLQGCKRPPLPPVITSKADWN